MSAATAGLQTPKNGKQDATASKRQPSQSLKRVYIYTHTYIYIYIYIYICSRTNPMNPKSPKLDGVCDDPRFPSTQMGRQLLTIAVELKEKPKAREIRTEVY